MNKFLLLRTCDFLPVSFHPKPHSVFLSDIPAFTLFAFPSKDICYLIAKYVATVLVIAFALVLQLLNSHPF